jgi:hypothetical protein
LLYLQSANKCISIHFLHLVSQSFVTTPKSRVLTQPQFVRYPRCQRTCCEKCTGQCDADALSLADLRAATPPLDYDEEDDSLSSPSSPTPTRERIATPDPDANVLRARLSLAARSLSANSLLLQKKRKRRDGANNSSYTSFNANGTAPSAINGAGRTLSLSPPAYSGVSDMGVMMMDVQTAPVAPTASRHRHHLTQYNQETPPATFRYTALRASTTDSGVAGYQGCSSRLCSQCLVRTVDG